MSWSADVHFKSKVTISVMGWNLFWRIPLGRAEKLTNVGMSHFGKRVKKDDQTLVKYSDLRSRNWKPNKRDWFFSKGVSCLVESMSSLCSFIVPRCLKIAIVQENARTLSRTVSLKLKTCACFQSTIDMSIIKDK